MIILSSDQSIGPPAVLSLRHGYLLPRYLEYKTCEDHPPFLVLIFTRIHHQLFSDQLIRSRPSFPSSSSAILWRSLTNKMKFSTLALLATAEVALGARLTEHRRARHEEKVAKRAAQRNSQPRLAATDLSYNETSHVSYSTNWAGAVLIGTDYESVTGTITVPTPAAGSGSSLKSALEGYCASAWVGIDGDTCSTAILQTGVDFCYQDGDVTYDAWYEWYPGKYRIQSSDITAQ